MKHYNTSITDDAYRIFNLKGEPIEDIAPFIQPTKEISRRCNIIKTATSSGASSTIYTTPSDKDFYLVSAQLSVIKDATSTSTAETLVVQVDGVSVGILSVSSITLTAQSEVIANTWNPPIKIDRNSLITVGGTAAIANINIRGNIQGYTEETTKGV